MNKRIINNGMYLAVWLLLLVACQWDDNSRADMGHTDVQPGIYGNTTEHAKSWYLYPIDTSIRYVTGHFDPAKDSVFTLIHPRFADRSGMYLRKDAYKAFITMDSTAREDGINLQIRSATRNFDYQKTIWEKKWSGQTPIENGERLNESTPDPVERAKKILRYSSMPGTSRHHWGTEIDLNNFTNRFFEHGEGLALYTWMQENAADFGFRQPYTKRDSLRPEGYNEEKWHWSFYPVADVLTSYAADKLKNSMITGFKGAETADEIDVVKKYVLGINPEMLDVESQ